MADDTILTAPVEPSLHAAFLEAADIANRPPSHILRDLIEDYVSQHASPEDYDAFLHRKVSDGRGDVARGDVRTQDQIEKQASERRAVLIGRVRA